MSQSYLDKTGLQYLWGKIKSAIPSTYAGSSSAGGAANKAVSIPFGQLDSTSTSTVMTATVDGVTELRDGVCVYLRNNVIASATNFTLNVNGLGAKPVYRQYADATRETTGFAKTTTYLFVYNSTRVSGGCWDIYWGNWSYNYSAYNTYDYYFRPYAGSAIYRYKLCMLGEDNRLYPIVTTDQTSATQVAKAPQTVGLRPNKIWFYNTTTATSAGAVTPGTVLYSKFILSGTTPYTFNESVPTYQLVYLRGTYDKTKGLFYLYNDGASPCKSYYAFAPTNTANVNLSNYFTQGYYYILVGGSYSSVNYMSLFETNPMFYFDGTNLIPASDIDDLSEASVIEDNEPYVFRKTGGKAVVGDRTRKSGEIVGGSVAWNQLLNVPTQTYTSNNITFVGDSGIVTITVPTGGATAETYWQIADLRDNLIAGHKYFVGGGLSSNIYIVYGGGLTASAAVVQQASGFGRIRVTVANGTPAGTYKVIPQLTDLTLMFGSTIADYIYSLEQATAGAGVAWFRKLFPKSYYAYDAGSIQSVKVSKHTTTGRNQYNNGTAKVLGGYEYKIEGTYTSLSLNGETITPVSGLFTPSQDGTLTVTGGGDDTIIYIHWDETMDDDYEPYVKNEYAIDDIDLRGTLKLDSNNNLYYDGDVYESDGTVNRRYGIVDLGSLTWHAASDISTTGHAYASGDEQTFDYKKSDDVMMVCSKYVFDGKGISSIGYYGAEGTIRYYAGINAYEVYVADSAFKTLTAEQIKTAMSGVYLVYPLATPTTESADPYQSPQVCDNWGTEEFTDAGVEAGTRDVAVPVGHTTEYTTSSRDKLLRLPEPASSDGDYIVHQEDGQMSLAEYTAPADAATANPVMDGTAAVGTSTKYAREDHRHPTDTSRAPTSHASSATTYGAGTDSNYGHVKLSDSTTGTAAAASGGTAATPAAVKAVKDAIPTASTTNPSMDGTASYGSGTAYARSNHVHPTDTSRAPTNHASTTTTYGAGSSSNYGHVKLSNSTASTSGTSDGTAATPKAVTDAYNKVISMGEQLVVNGNGLMHDNTNFSSFTFDGSVAYGSPGSFTFLDKVSHNVYTNYNMPVDISKTYRVDIDLISENALSRIYMHLVEYDVDGNTITAQTTMYRPNTLTTLAEDLKNGDTQIHLSDMSNWDVNTGTRTYQKGIIAWNYTNSYGYTYPENTYSRNYYTSLYTDDSSVNKTTGIITLSSPWSKGTIPAGTKVSQSDSGGAYRYLITNTLIPSTWTHYTRYITGTDYTGRQYSGKFSPGTAYVRVGFLWNYNNANDQTWATNISLKEAVRAADVVNDGFFLESSSPVPIANGGTGQTTVANAINYLIQNGCTAGSSDPIDGDTYLASYADGKNTAGNGTNTFHRRPILKLWNYMQGKISSVLGLTASTYGGSAAKVNNHTVNSDVPANAVFTDTTYTPASANPLMDGTVAVGTSAKYAREDHKHPTDTSRAPTAHASSGTSYGAGSGSNYGHVKLSDATNGTSAASGGIAATPKAVSDALAAAKTYTDNKADNNTTYDLAGTALPPDDDGYLISLTGSDSTTDTVLIPDMDGTTNLDRGLITYTDWSRFDDLETAYTGTAPGNFAPKSHASTATTYGKGTDSNYGHVKLSDSTTSTSGKSDGVAATPAAVKAVKDAIPSVPTASTTNPSMDGTASYGSGTAYARSNHVHPTDTSRAPNNHASSATTYGTGTSSNYGHLKLSDSTSSTSSTSGGIAATPKAVKDALAAAKSYTDNALPFTAVYTLSSGTGSCTEAFNDISTAITSQPVFAVIENMDDGSYTTCGVKMNSDGDIVIQHMEVESGGTFVLTMIIHDSTDYISYTTEHGYLNITP